jgi:hypothetical protein
MFPNGPEHARSVEHDGSGKPAFIERKLVDGQSAPREPEYVAGLVVRLRFEQEIASRVAVEWIKHRVPLGGALWSPGQRHVPDPLSMPAENVLADAKWKNVSWRLGPKSRGTAECPSNSVSLD